MRAKTVADAAARSKKRKNKYLSMLEKMELIKKLEIGMSALYIYGMSWQGYVYVVLSSGIFCDPAIVANGRTAQQVFTLIVIGSLHWRSRYNKLVQTPY